ncbi:hypothetical protein BHE74_00051855 [Ensete ventricosum]|nr:hypothetical protein GW17_00018884 [Ensete ventricosum]RWW42586.1 hypothetical protein BHE74_00051855 [Ensete ventricosum]
MAAPFGIGSLPDEMRLKDVTGSRGQKLSSLCLRPRTKAGDRTWRSVVTDPHGRKVDEVDIFLASRLEVDAMASSHLCCTATPKGKERKGGREERERHLRGQNGGPTC